MREFFRAFKMCACMVLITGIAYPLLMIGIAQLFFKSKADGSLIYHEGKVVGATLIGQKFAHEDYFWGRPSATDYNALPSGGSNLGPTSARLKEIVADRRRSIAKADPTVNSGIIPPELLFASGSGLDPHISPKAAIFQINRIAKARGFDDKKTAQLKTLIADHTEKPLFGPQRVNVLKINMALNQMAMPQAKTSEGS